MDKKPILYWSRIPAGILFGVAVLTTVSLLRLTLTAEKRVREATQLLNSGDRRAAVVALEDAAKAYFPGNFYTQKALRELAILARSEEMQGNNQGAIHIWEVKRRAILSTRHFFQPHLQDLKEAENSMMRIYGTKMPNLKKQSPVMRPRDPSPILSIVLFLGLFVWLAGSVVLAITPPVSPISKTRPLAWLASVGGLGIWLYISSII